MTPIHAFAGFVPQFAGEHGAQGDPATRLGSAARNTRQQSIPTNVGGTLPTSVADPREHGDYVSRQPGSSVPHALLPGSSSQEHHLDMLRDTAQGWADAWDE